VSLDYARFLAFSNVVLGAIVGVLIAIPLTPAVSSGPLAGTLVLASGLLGAAVGRKRGASRGFLYFALVAVLVLASLVSRSIVPPAAG
jgi:hypothetical protein